MNKINNHKIKHTQDHEEEMTPELFVTIVGVGILILTFLLIISIIFLCWSR